MVHKRFESKTLSPRNRYIGVLVVGIVELYFSDSNLWLYILFALCRRSEWRRLSTSVHYFQSSRLLFLMCLWFNRSASVGVTVSGVYIQLGITIISSLYSAIKCQKLIFILDWLWCILIRFVFRFQLNV